MPSAILPYPNEKGLERENCEEEDWPEPWLVPWLLLSELCTLPPVLSLP
jgi:hypothetical protein